MYEKSLLCFLLLRYIILQLYFRAAVTLLAEQLAPDLRSRIQGSSDEISQCTQFAPSACKIHLGCNVLQVPVQIVPLEVQKQITHTIYTYEYPIQLMRKKIQDMTCMVLFNGSIWICDMILLKLGVTRWWLLQHA